jgi:hypothetical protein
VSKNPTCLDAVWSMAEGSRSDRTARVTFSAAF